MQQRFVIKGEDVNFETVHFPSVCSNILPNLPTYVWCVYFTVD